MKTSDFEKELQKIDQRLAIVENPNRQGLSNVKLDGKDICPVPSDEIKEKPDPTYTYTFPNGMVTPHNSIEDALTKVNYILEYIQTPYGKDIFFENE